MELRAGVWAREAVQSFGVPERRAGAAGQSGRQELQSSRRAKQQAGAAVWSSGLEQGARAVVRSSGQEQQPGVAVWSSSLERQAGAAG